MKRKSAGIRLYNIIFPLFMLMLLSPELWLVMLAGNFLIDSLVLYLSMTVRHIPDFGHIWKKSILRVFLFGFLSDFLGALVNTILYIGLSILLPDAMSRLNFYFWPGCAITAIPAVLIAALLIFFFNRKFSFQKTDLSEKSKRRIALDLALFTAPYLMFVPMDLLAVILIMIRRLF